MSTEANKALIRHFMDRAFNHGDLGAVDEHVGMEAVDHQEPLGTNFCTHLKQVITALRTAFPDLHFEIHEIVAEGDIVAFRSTMTGTHRGVFAMGAAPPLPATERRVAVPHMHFVRVVNGKGYDLWHQWDTAALLRQLGTLPEQPRPAS